MTQQEIINEIVASGDIGISSATMLFYFDGVMRMSHLDAPYDNSDFGRCWRLVKKLPRIKEIFTALMLSNTRRASIINNRDMFGKLYEEQVAGLNDGKQLYRLLQVIAISGR